MSAPVNAWDPHYPRGVFMIGLAGMIASFNGFFFREMEAATDWQAVFWRSGVMFVCLGLLLIVQSGGRPLRAAYAAGWPAVLGGVLLGTSNICFSLAVVHTTVANALFILSASPFIAAIFARVLLGESSSRATASAMTVALGGVGLMVEDGLSGANSFGNLIALGAAFTVAGFITALRFRGGVEMLPAVVIAGAFGALVAMAMAGDVRVSPRDTLLGVGMGVFTMSLSFWLFTRGARHVPAAQVALLALMEVVFGPMWMALFGYEVPSPVTIAGGALVLSAILGQAVWGIRRVPQANA